MMTRPSRRFNGRHMTAIMVAFFGVVIAVNLVMARLATSTFGGEVVENSYIASQQFNRWLDEAAAEQALGWRAETSRLPDGRVMVRLSGAPDTGVRLLATARHPLGTVPDRTLGFAAQGDGRFLSTAALPSGRWRLRLDARVAHSHWRHEEDLP